MILSKKYLRSLVNKGVAKEEGIVQEGDELFRIVTRFDIQRTDHYFIGLFDSVSYFKEMKN